VALSGALPASSLLHLALNHLRCQPALAPDDEQDSESERDGAARKRRKREEEVERHVLILTPDRTALREALIKEKDLSLMGSTRDAQTTAVLDRVDIK
jgi:hypothetical protein